MMKRRPILAILFLPRREEHLTDTQYGFRRIGHWLMIASIFASTYSYGWEQLRESLGVGGMLLGLIIGGTCGFGAGQLWRLAIETESEGGKIVYRGAWFVCMGVVLWGMFTLFNNGLNDSYRALQAAERRDASRIEQADAKRGDPETLATRLQAANQQIERAQNRLTRAGAAQALVARVVASEQSVVCTRNAEIVALQTSMNIEPIDGCARGITGGAVVAEVATAQAEMTAATAVQSEVFAEQSANTATVASGEVAGIELQANEAAQVGGFARFFRGVSLLSYKAQGWIKGERNGDQDNLFVVDDRSMTIGAISMLLLATVIDLLSPVFNSVGSRKSGDDGLRLPDRRVPLLMPPGSARAAPPAETFVPVAPGAYALRSASVPDGYRSSPRPPALAAGPAATRPEPDKARLGAESALAGLKAKNRAQRP
jgi:hypothetical protein